MKIVLILFFIIHPLFGRAQAYEESKPCDYSVVHDYLKGIQYDEIGALAIEELVQSDINNLYYSDWSTSILKPTGEPPKIDTTQEDELGYTKIEYDDWSCMYSAYKAFDGDASTAWAEGVKGNGIGEILIASVDITKKVQIWGGLGKSELLHKANNRPKRIKIYLLESVGEGMAVDYVEWCRHLIFLNSTEIELKDVNGYQELPLPKFELKKPDDYSYTFIAVEILSVYAGTKYDDTCISEINNVREEK